MSACGSGGSGSGVSNSNPTTPTPPTKPTVTEFKQAGYGSQGTASTNLAAATSDGAKYTYQYEGKTLDITLPNIKAGTVVSSTDGSGLTTVVGGSTYSYSRFGAVFQLITNLHLKCSRSVYRPAICLLPAALSTKVCYSATA